MVVGIRGPESAGSLLLGGSSQIQFTHPVIRVSGLMVKLL